MRVASQDAPGSPKLVIHANALFAPVDGSSERLRPVITEAGQNGGLGKVRVGEDLRNQRARSGGLVSGVAVVCDVIDTQETVRGCVWVIRIRGYVFTRAAIVGDAQLGEVAVLLGHCWDVRRACRTPQFAVPFLRPEEKQLVFYHRTADVVAPVVAAENVLLDSVEIVEVVGGIQRIVAAEVVSAAMESVRTTAGDQVDDCAHGLAVFGTITIAKNLEFLNGVNRWIYQDRTIRTDVVVVDAIHHEYVASGVIAIDGKIDASQQALVFAVKVGLRRDAGHQLRQLDEAASVER